MTSARLKLKVLPAATAAVNKSIRSLRTFPERGALVDPTSPVLRNIRRLPDDGFSKFPIFYRFDTATRTVAIVRVIHGSRDLKSLLGLGPEE